MGTDPWTGLSSSNLRDACCTRGSLNGGFHCPLLLHSCQNRPVGTEKKSLCWECCPSVIRSFLGNEAERRSYRSLPILGLGTGEEIQSQQHTKENVERNASRAYYPLQTVLWFPSEGSWLQCGGVPL